MYKRPVMFRWTCKGIEPFTQDRCTDH